MKTAQMNKTQMNKILMTVSFMAVMAVAAPAMANPSVLCSVRDSYKGSAASVSPHYQPGVDVHGKAVVPADVSAPAMTVPQTTRIPLTVDLAQRLNDVLPAGMKLESTVGLVEIGSSGSVSINGKDLSGPADAMCATIEKQKAAAMKTKDTPKRKKAAPAKPATPVVDAPAVEAAPAPEVAAPEAVVAPVIEAPAIEAPVTPPVVEPTPAAPAPQILEPAPMPEAVAPEAAAPAPAPAAATPEAQGEILSPAENGIPRPPEADPLAPPPANDGTLSGGAQ